MMTRQDIALDIAVGMLAEAGIVKVTWLEEEHRRRRAGLPHRIDR